jgi:NADH-quinone oxidoreductase subunit J
MFEMEAEFLGLSPSFLLFVPVAVLTVAGAAGVAFSRNIVYAAFSLLASFVGMVGLFAFLSADFLAVVQLMVYVGGILVLILFAVMLTNRISEVRISNPVRNVAFGGLLLVILTFTLLEVVWEFDWRLKLPGPYAPTAETIGAAFLNEYLLPFEVAGLLLLAALLAAVVVARKEIRDPEEREADEKAP